MNGRSIKSFSSCTSRCDNLLNSRLKNMMTTRQNTNIRRLVVGQRNQQSYVLLNEWILILIHVSGTKSMWHCAIILCNFRNIAHLLNGQMNGSTMNTRNMMNVNHFNQHTAAVRRHNSNRTLSHDLHDLNAMANPPTYSTNDSNNRYHNDLKYRKPTSSKFNANNINSSNTLNNCQNGVFSHDLCHIKAKRTISTSNKPSTRYIVFLGVCFDVFFCICYRKKKQKNNNNNNDSNRYVLVISGARIVEYFNWCKDKRIFGIFVPAV